mmetsp:Transcript_11194/g.31590  ORF Transcript_11194/g.31590 Transcript_11194/m.31590 type:complete len:217 (-) Transcript_11194:3590-4240(-)
MPWPPRFDGGGWRYGRRSRRPRNCIDDTCVSLVRRPRPRRRPSPSPHPRAAACLPRRLDPMMAVRSNNLLLTRPRPRLGPPTMPPPNSSGASTPGLTPDFLCSDRVELLLPTSSLPEELATAGCPLDPITIFRERSVVPSLHRLHLLPPLRRDHSASGTTCTKANWAEPSLRPARSSGTAARPSASCPASGRNRTIWTLICNRRTLSGRPTSSCPR